MRKTGTKEQVNAVAEGLARLATLQTQRGNAEQASPSRSHILRLVRDAEDPISVEQMCAVTGLHANTVRGHLEVLLAGGQVKRFRSEPQGRGRRPWLYHAGERAVSQYEQLSTELVGQLAETLDDQAIAATAKHWAEQVDRPRQGVDPDDAVAATAETLRRMGFATEISPVGDSLVLKQCPYNELVTNCPVVCEIHTVMLSDLIGEQRQGLSLEGMVVWARPGVCSAHLTRPDLVPERTITV